MRTYLIGYDLNRPRGVNDYPKLIQAIKDLAPNHWHELDSTWIVKVNSTVTDIRDALQVYIDSGDELLVLRLTRYYAAKGFSDSANAWLKNNMSDD